MRKIVFVSLAFLFISSRMFAQIGDTVTVQAFTFGSPQDAWFVFPSDTVRFEKVLMQYTLKCNPAQNPACGEWDYTTFTYLYDHTGLQDSSLVHQPVYRVNGATPGSVQYMNSPSYSYHPSWQTYIVHTDTFSMNLFPSGTPTAPSGRPFGTSQPVSRSQYLWRAGELTASGMTAGDITGIRFNLQSPGGMLHNMTIRLRATTLDSLTQGTLLNTGFTTVYSMNTSFLSTGWNGLQFNTPFSWNGTSNILVEITYDNGAAATDNIVLGENVSYHAGLYSAGNDRAAAFHDYGYVSVPVNNAVAAIDSFVTVTFWAYGNPLYQPRNGSTFYAVDAAGNRVLNSHTPWSDSRVYWDAGNSSGYDRIDKAATTTEYEGQWNHWAFTKNVATGSMKIYLNGNLWHSGTGKTKRMGAITAFQIGQEVGAGTTSYDGRIDEFAVFNKELDQTTIQQYMNRPIGASHPNFGNLAVYYNFNDGNYVTAADGAPGGHNPGLLNSVDNPLKSSAELTGGLTQTYLRPAVIFERGTFTSSLDSVLVIDSTVNAPMQIVFYADSVSNPGVATDTLTVWPAYYNQYQYDAQGNAIDSAFVTPDSMLNLVYYDWYTLFPQVLRYELARYITPYGNGLSLGNGFTWTFDVSDYRTLLADSVHLSGGNWQELLDMKFIMIKGIPPRDVLSIRNLWNGYFAYGVASDPIENHLQPKTIQLPVNAVNTRWKSRITGHGMDTPQNCAEFCPKSHYFKVDNALRYTQLVWRDNCDLNPLYPQGGTWVYDRANWCPGAEVWTYDLELTPYVTPGNTIVLDHDVQPYTSNGPWNGYEIADQLVTYGAPNFTLDAAIEDVLSPSANQMWLRYNPICNNPVIRIKNTGSAPLTSLTINYGMEGVPPSVYNWTGNLAFLQTEEVTLGNFTWAPGADKFTVNIEAPNGGTDQYAYNNTQVTAFTYPLTLPSEFVIEFKTNNSPSENQYTVKDASGNVVLSRSGLSANTNYKDTLNLAAGCYEFELTDSGEDGLTWWANTAQGSGIIRFRSATSANILKSFNSDFGGKVYQHFTVGLSNGIGPNDPGKSTLNVYPNPSEGQVYIDVDFVTNKDGNIEITDMLGQKVFAHPLQNFVSGSILADMSGFSGGIYFVTLHSGNERITRKLVIR